MYKVFIGVGHGGSDPGAVANGLRESDVNLIMALAMRKELLRHGVDVKMSRATDENDRLADEIRECNDYKPDVAVEIHNNAGGGKGFECYVRPGATLSYNVAILIAEEMRNIGRTLRGNKGVKTSSTLGWVNKVTAPCVLCEGFFLDSDEANAMKTPESQERFGVAYAKAVLKWFGISYNPLSGYRGLVKEKYRFEEATMQYLDNYRYADALYERLLSV